MQGKGIRKGNAAPPTKNKGAAKGKAKDAASPASAKKGRVFIAPKNPSKQQALNLTKVRGHESEAPWRCVLVELTAAATACAPRDAPHRN